jgi:ferredoxin
MSERPSGDDRAHAVTVLLPRQDLRNRDDLEVDPADPLAYDRGVETRFDDWVQVTIPVGADEFVLVAARERGYWLPATCQQGWCTTCAARLLEGSVDNAAAKRYYDVDELEGWILPCTARPTSDCTIQVHLEPQFGEHRDEHGLPP